MTRPFVAESRTLLAAAPVQLPGRELRTAGSVWVDLLGHADSLMVTVFPIEEGQDFEGLWVVAAQPGGHCRYERLDRNGQCVVRDLRAGRWDVGLLEADHVPQAPVATPVPEFGTLLEALSDDDPIACCEALDAVRDAAKGEVWSAVDIEPIVAQLRDNGEAVVRKAAAELLGEVGGPSAAPPLLAAVDDPVWFVQHAAVVSLGMVGDADISVVLQGVRGDADRDPAVREAAEEVLARLGQVVHTGWKVFRPQGEAVVADLPVVHPALAAAEAARLLERIDPAVGAVVERDGVALLVNPHPSDRDTVVVAVQPGADVAGLAGSLWSLGPEARVHSGRFDELAQLQLPGVESAMRYDLRIMGEHRTRSIHDLVTSSASPVPVRNTAGDGEPVTLLVVSDQDGRTVTIRRTSGDVVVAEVAGLGITDRRMVARLPIRTSGSLRLLAPLRWNYRTDRCEARLRLLDTDVLADDVTVEVSRPDELEPELADPVSASIVRADPDTAAVWTALAAEPGLHQRITTAIRTAQRGDW